MNNEFPMKYYEFDHLTKILVIFGLLATSFWGFRQTVVQELNHYHLPVCNLAEEKNIYIPKADIQ
jgi:hypothetical protein